MTYFDGFQGNATVYAPVNGRALIWASVQAYLDAGPDRTAALAGEGLTERIDLTDPTQARGLDWFLDTQGFIAERSDCIVMAFRGSEPADGRDWITDFEFAPMEVMSGLIVHGGFWRALNQVWLSKIMPNIALLRSKPLWITGHSLGGAIAVLAAMRLFRELPGGPTAQGVYTFGQPRVAKLGFAAAYQASPLWNRTFRFVNNMDIVPRVPPRVLKYCHVGRCGFFNNNRVLGPQPMAIEALQPWRETFIGYGDTLNGVTNLQGLQLLSAFRASLLPGDLVNSAIIHAVTSALRSSTIGELRDAIKNADATRLLAAGLPPQAADHFGQAYLQNVIDNMARNPF